MSTSRENAGNASKVSQRDTTRPNLNLLARHQVHGHDADLSSPDENSLPVSREGSIFSNLQDMLGGGGRGHRAPFQLSHPAPVARPASQGRPPTLAVSPDDLLFQNTVAEPDTMPGQIITPRAQPAARTSNMGHVSTSIFKGSLTQLQQNHDASAANTMNRPGHDSAGSIGMAPTTAHVESLEQRQEQQGAWDGFVNSELCKRRTGCGNAWGMGCVINTCTGLHSMR